MRILLIEDERPLAISIRKMLEQESFAVDLAHTGPTGLDAMLSGIYDAVILDVMLPGMDGFAVLTEVRRQGKEVPVLMLTAMGELADRVRGLNAGADYYLSKPFEKSELIACLNVITRRGGKVQMGELAYGTLTLSREQAALMCSRTGQSVKLGAKEYQLMELFMRNPEQLLPRETIVERIWGFESEAEYNNLSVYLSFLRSKMEFIGATAQIRASRGLGYMLEEKA